MTFEFCMFELVLSIEFQLKLKFYFLDQFYQKKATFQVKESKIEYHHSLLHIRVSLGTKFQLKLKILIFLDQICPKRVFPVENGQSERHRCILFILISLVTKFHFKQTILSFWTRFAQKGYFRSKTKKTNITIEFFKIKSYVFSKKSF